MWVRKQDGELVNIDRAEYIYVRSYGADGSKMYAVSAVNVRIVRMGKSFEPQYTEVAKKLYKSASEEDCDRVLRLVAANIAKGTVVMDLTKLPEKGA